MCASLGAFLAGVSVSVSPSPSLSLSVSLSRAHAYRHAEAAAAAAAIPDIMAATDCHDGREEPALWPRSDTMAAKRHYGRDSFTLLATARTPTLLTAILAAPHIIDVGALLYRRSCAASASVRCIRVRALHSRQPTASLPKVDSTLARRLCIGAVIPPIPTQLVCSVGPHCPSRACAVQNHEGARGACGCCERRTVC